MGLSVTMVCYTEQFSAKAGDQYVAVSCWELLSNKPAMFFVCSCLICFLHCKLKCLFLTNFICRIRSFLARGGFRLRTPRRRPPIGKAATYPNLNNWGNECNSWQGIVTYHVSLKISFWVICDLHAFEIILVLHCFLLLYSAFITLQWFYYKDLVSEMSEHVVF
jgi:hypothetical protein